MTHCCGGLLSEDDFQLAIDSFMQASSKLRDTWQREILTQGNVKVTYLRRRTGKWMKVSSPRKGEIELENSDNLLTEQTENVIGKDLMEIGDGTDSLNSQDESKVYCHLEHNIVYSQSYSVPVIYFNIFLPGGELLTLDDLWENSLCQVPYEVDNRWAFITQQEHPYLKRPFFQLHPCHTAELMKEITCNVLSMSPGVFLMSWLSSVAPLVHLDLSLQYANEIHCTTQ